MDPRARPGPADGGLGTAGSGRTGDRRGEDQVAEVAEAVLRSAVLLDPSGRRWRRTRVVGTAALVILLAAAVLVAPGLWHSPALPAAEPGRAVTVGADRPRDAGGR